MKRQSLSLLHLVSLFFWVGCSSPAVDTKEELRAQSERIDIIVFTKDSTEYKFLKNNYGIQGDTLTGYGVRRRNMSSDIVLDASLPLADVAAIETRKFDFVKTLLLYGVGGLFGVLAIEHFLNIHVN